MKLTARLEGVITRPDFSSRVADNDGLNSVSQGANFAIEIGSQKRLFWHLLSK